jgi:hypothetical protein
VLYVQLSTTKNEDHILRLLILVAAATLVISGAAKADESVGTNAKGAHHHHHHYRDANASVAEDSGSADTLSAHEMHIKNLHDSGYNPARDFNGAGNVQTSW